MPQTTTQSAKVRETASLHSAMVTIGTDSPLTIGNAVTGETCELPEQAAVLVRQVLSGLAAGHEISVIDNLSEFTLDEAARFLNVSRPYLMKLLQDGALHCRMEDGQIRLTYAVVAEYQHNELVRSRAALDELYELDRQTGLSDYNPSPEENPLVDQSGR